MVTQMKDELADCEQLLFSSNIKCFLFANCVASLTASLAVAQSYITLT